LTRTMLGAFVYAAILVILSILTIRKPPVALVGILCMFGLEQLGLIYLPFLRTHGTFTNVYILLLVILAVALSYRSGRFAIGINNQHSKVWVLSISLYLFAFLSLTWAPGNPWDNWTAAWPYLIANIILAPLLIGRIDDLEQVQKTFIWLGGSLVLFLAFVPDWGPRSLLIVGTEDDLGLPLALAQMSGYLLIMATIHFRKNYLSIGCLSLVLIGALVVAIRTDSRGQLIFSILSIVLVSPLIWKRISIKNASQLVVAITFIVLLSFFIFDALNVYSDRWKATEMIVDFAVRFGMTKAVLTEWINSPLAIIFGLGNSASFSDDVLGTYPHIVPLEVLGEEGFIGFILFIFIVLLSVKQAKHLSALTFLSKDLKKVYAANFGCFVYTLLLSLKQGSLLNSSVLFLFAVVSEKYFYLIKRELYRNESS